MKKKKGKREIFEKWLLYKTHETNVNWDLEKLLAPQQFIASGYINSFLKTYNKNIDNNLKKYFEQ